MNCTITPKFAVISFTYLAFMVLVLSLPVSGQMRLTDADVPLIRPILPALSQVATKDVALPVLPRNSNTARLSRSSSLKTATAKTARAIDLAGQVSGSGNRESELEKAVLTHAARHRIDPLLLYALIGQESGGRARARSYKGAMGVMQLMPSTARRFGVRDPFQVSEGVRGGVEYLAWLPDYFKGDVVKALAGYNAGEGAVTRYHGVPPYRETQDYVRQIARRYQNLLHRNHLQRSTPK